MGADPIHDVGRAGVAVELDAVEGAVVVHLASLAEDAEVVGVEVEGGASHALEHLAHFVVHGGAVEVVRAHVLHPDGRAQAEDVVHGLERATGGMGRVVARASTPVDDHV